MKSVDAATDALKQLGLDPEATDMFGKVMKKALELSTDVKSVGCSLTKDGKPRIKVEFNSPISVGPLTLGAKAPLEFTISPSASKAGIAFTDIKGAKIGIGPLQTDLTSASLSFKDNDPKLTLNKTVTLPLSGLMKLVAK